MAKELQVLTALDAARTQLYHFTAILIAGMGFFTDGYDLFCISTVTRLLGRIYYYDASTGKPGALPAHVQAAVNGVALCGTLAGHLFFGCLGDSMGRKKAYGFTLQLMVAFSLASGLSFGSSRKAVMTTLCFVRFWLGFGVGGDYPLSATIMSEFANKRTRGAFIAAVFAMQGLGILAGTTVSIVVAAAFMNGKNIPSFDAEAETSTPRSADYVWRIVLMFGAIPAGLTYYWRMKMPETPRYTALVARDAKQAALDMSKVLPVELTGDAEYDDEQQYREKAPQYGLFSYEFLRRHGLHLLGTTSTWFLLDIAFYSQNLLQKDLFTAVGWIPDAKEMNAVEEVFRVARAQALVALFSTVPGYWFTVLFVERLGRFGIQFMGFVFMTVFMLAVSIPYDHWRGHACENDSAKLCGGHPLAFVVLYAFTFFFSNFGPNSTTFIVPAELFPARLRSTCHGISAAAGKAGAVVGMFGFLYASQSPDIGIRWALIILGITNGLGALFTLLVPETKGKSLEELSGENMETKGKSPEELSGEDLETKGKSLEELSGEDLETKGKSLEELFRENLETDFAAPYP